jgi:predicted phage baseplate assembly protein
MTLPTPTLDDRKFQDIVDQMKTLIPRYCPEWTDHNVSDPGITLIELFAWMTDMVLYRVNQVPDKMYIKFLEMIGVTLDPPRAARVPVTFYLSAPQPADITIPEGTEVATIRTETSPAIVFTTERDMTVRPPNLLGAYTRTASGAWVVHDLRQLDLPGQSIPLFQREPVVGDAFYLGFSTDHSHHVLSLVVECELAGGAGVDPENPPWEWQVWQGSAARWVNCELEYDATGGFNESGEIVLHTPEMAERTIERQAAYWLRCRLTPPEPGQGAYRVSPDILDLEIQSRGGTVPARHAQSVRNELLGQSDGRPGQIFNLLHSPVLARDPQRDVFVVETPGEAPEIWREAPDFGDSGPSDKHFVLDSLSGELTLGPSLLQPDGSVYTFGAVPPKGSTLRFRHYQYGGGVNGNVPRNTVTVPKSSIPYVARVTNRAPAVGGRNAQSLDNARVLAPQTLRTRTRAVTADDFEYLASELPGVARARCLGPGAHPGGTADPRPGQVFVYVLPQVDQVDGEITLDRLALSAELRSGVISHLDERRLLGTSLDVRSPLYMLVSVRTRIRVAERSDPDLAADVEGKASAALYRYLNPFIGGPDGNGWPFGRPLHQSEIYGLLQGITGVEFVEEVRLEVRQPGGAGQGQAAPPRLEIPRNALICSGQHNVTVA